MREPDAWDVNSMPTGCAHHNDRWARPQYDPDTMDRVQVDPDLLESRLRIARLMANGPLTTEPGE